LKRRSAPAVALALLASLAAGPASAVTTNFSDDVETAIDRGIDWHDAQGHLSAVNNSCGEGAGLAALAVLEKRRDASQNALSQGWAFANAADRTRIENVVTYVATRAAQPLPYYNYRDGADAMALALYLRTSGPDANNLTAPNLPQAAAGLAAATDRLLQTQQPFGYWCYADPDPNGCPDSSVTQLAIAGLAAARATFLTPAFADPGRVASIDAALQLTGNLYATNNHVGALEPGELAHGYQGARPDLGVPGSGGSLQQTASGTWAMLVGGRTVNDAPVQSYLRWLRNRFRYTDLNIDGEGWIHSLRYFMWSATKSFRLIETAGNALPGVLTPADVGGLDPAAAPAYGPRQPHLDPTLVVRPASFGAGGAGYYADPNEPARWYFDFAYTLLTHQDLNAGAPADFGYFVPPANVANGSYWNACADQAWAILVLERALGGLCLDDDGDGICNDEDDCPQEADPDQVDENGNGIGDACETCCGLPAAAPAASSVEACVSGGGQLLPPAACCVDTDADGVCDAVDNCIDDPNPNQADSNENGIGDACESGCCRLPDGTVLTLDYAKCLGGQGVIEPAEVCEEVVCCQPHAGGPASLVPFSQCQFGVDSVVDDLLCCASEMCCLLPGDALESTLYADCIARNGVSVPQSFCDTPVCCRQGDGHYAALSPHDCAATGGAPAVALPGGPADAAAYCIDTCCRAPEVGFVTLPVGDCLGAQGVIAEPASCQQPICCGTEQGAQILAPLNCEAAGGAALDAVWCEDVCCRGIGPEPIDANRLDCVQQGGIVVDAEACNPPVCCALPGGVVAEISPADCALQGGTPTAQAKCDSVACCITAAGNVSYAGVADCLAAGGHVDANGAACEKEVCCLRADGSTVIAPFSACVAGGGTETGADACVVGAVACCAFRDGSVVFMDLARCRDSGGAQTEIAACQREVCCEITGQRPAYAQASACTEAGGATVADALCQADVEVCCMYRDGTTAFRLLQDCRDGGGLRVGVAECQAPICCDLPDRTAYTLSDPTCTTQQGAAAAENYCAGPVCCVLPDGTSETTTLGACEAQRGRVQADASCALDVCCQTRGGASFADPAACAIAGGAVVPDNTCLQPACCETNGVLSRVTPPVCVRGGGARVDEASCDRPACCETSPEVFEVGTALGCAATEVSMRVCLTLDAAAALRVGNNPLTDPAPAAPAARNAAGCATTAGAPAGTGALAAFVLLGLSLATRRRRAARAPRASRQELVK
jgi:hypothetical protein